MNQLPQYHKYKCCLCKRLYKHEGSLIRHLVASHGDNKLVDGMKVRDDIHKVVEMCLVARPIIKPERRTGFSYDKEGRVCCDNCGGFMSTTTMGSPTCHPCGYMSTAPVKAYVAC